VKYSNQRAWLLRMRCERPCRCRAAEKRDELAPFHSMEMHLLPQLGAAAYRIGQHQVRASLHRKISLCCCCR
jgi:hypothetical protein